MRLFSKSKEKFEGISSKSTILLVIGLAVIAKLWEQMRKNSYLLDKLTISDVKMFGKLGSVLALLVCVAVVEYRRKKEIEKHGHYVPKTVMEKIITLIVDYTICAIGFVHSLPSAIQKQIRTVKRKRLIAKLEAWDARVEKYNKANGITGGEYFYVE